MPELSEHAVALRQIRLPILPKIAYSAGAFVDGITNNALTVFGLFYITAVCGVPGAWAGLAMSSGLVVDAALDPLIGSISDSWRSRWGRRLPFMLLGLPLVLLSFVLIFSLPAGLSLGWLIALLVVLSVSLRIAVSLFNLPYLAFGAELSDDYAERSRIAAWRWGLGMVGGLLAVLVGFGVFFKAPGSLSDRSAYPPFAMTCAALLCAGALGAIWATFSLRQRAHLPVHRPGGWLRELLGGIVEIFRNPSFRTLFAAAVFFFVAQGAALALSLHANTYFWRLKPDHIKLVTLAFFVGLMLGAPSIGAIAPRLEKKSLLLISLACLIASQALPASLRLVGLLPVTGAELAWLLAGNNFIGGLGLTGAAIAITSMLADAADEHEFLFGQRREGLYFAGWAFAGKAATGGGALVAGLVLQWSGFPSGSEADGTALAIGSETSRLLGLFYGPGASVFSLVGLALLLFYRLDRASHARILTQLSRRRAEAASRRAAATTPSMEQA